MSNILEATRIKLLTPDIASKIAAGEVVERPSSVLKELLENSIDAGATKIDISIVNGGIKNITVVDNGSGILPEDLTLAVQQHATSKITDVHDLSIITSLGFRGEALASINSVAKLSIISHTGHQPHAFCINGNNISAAAHPIGTTVKVTDLFYNIPARRKFLRSERTEYIYLEEIFRRIALSNFNIAFSLQHQGKIVKNLPACVDQASKNRRLMNLCGKQILAGAITIDAEQNGLSLWGWLGSVEHARSQEPHQYFFINGRIIRDRLINHAIRQVYQPLCAEGKMPFYCLYLELDPATLDVNVHPTKHEVRFRDARIIHTFLTQTLVSALNKDTIPKQSLLESGFSKHNYGLDMQIPSVGQTYKILAILENKMIVVQKNSRLILINVIVMHNTMLLQTLLEDSVACDLSTPLTVTLSNNLDFDEQFFVWCKQFGFTVECLGPQQLILRAMPLALHSMAFKQEILLPKLYLLWSGQADRQTCFKHIIDCINYTDDFATNVAQQCLQNLDVVPNQGFWREFSLEQLIRLCEV